ncbi:MAG: metallophosphoesterase [Bacteroidota bacterium]
MKIGLITDLHIGFEDENTYGVDVRSNFEAILQEVQRNEVNQLVIAGDLCFRDGEEVIYEWIKPKLDATGTPYHVIVGNHDSSSMMNALFGYDDLTDDRLYYKKQWNGWDALFLDSGLKNVDDVQLQWLEKQIQQSDNRIILFIHHPIVYAEALFMDEHHGLDNMQAVQQILAKSWYQIPVFSGHYHTEKIIVKDDFIQYITPSCFFQIDPRVPEFKVDHYDIAHRLIDLGKDSYRTTVRYIKGKKLSSEE